MKVFGVVGLVVSAVLYMAQIALFTQDQELAIYGLFGLLWFVALGGNTFNFLPMSRRFLISGLAGFGLGFVPHRLRLGGGFDLYVVLFPVVHFIATFIFLSAKQKSK